MGAELRKHQDMLIIIGTGVIAFGVWSVIKTVLYYALSRDEMLRILKEQGLEQGYEAGVYVLIALALAFILGLRIYIGLSARAEGVGKRRGNGYVVLAAIMTLVNFGGFVLSVAGAFELELTLDNIVDLSVTFVVELTSIATMAELVYSALRVRNLRKQIAD